MTLNAVVTGTATAGTIDYTFDLVDTKTGNTLSDSDLGITHEKVLHLVIYDSTLNEFQHVHPEYKSSHWTATVTLNVNGDYWFWAQGQIKSGKTDFSSPARLSISGGSPAWTATPLKDVRHGESGASVVDLGADKIIAGNMVMLDVTMSRNNSTDPNLSPYLGAFAHVIAVPESGDSIIHVHPMDGDMPNMGMLHATFPMAGKYRLWIQFIDDGDLKTIPLSVEVF